MQTTCEFLVHALITGGLIGAVLHTTHIMSSSSSVSTTGRFLEDAEAPSEAAAAIFFAAASSRNAALESLRASRSGVPEHPAPEWTGQVERLWPACPQMEHTIERAHVGEEGRGCLPASRAREGVRGSKVSIGFW